MNKIHQKDKRKYARLRAYHLVKYKILGDDQRGSFVLASLEDVGGGGVRIFVEENIPASTILELKINFPSLTAPIFTLARIVWSKQISKSGRYLLGAKFIEIDPLVQQRIGREIDFVYTRITK